MSSAHVSVFVAVLLFHTIGCTRSSVGEGASGGASDATQLARTGDSDVVEGASGGTRDFAERVRADVAGDNNSGDVVVRSKTGATLIDVVTNDIDGKPFDFSAQRGSVVLVVNTASECGYTPQYANLEKLHRRYKDQGLVVVGVPSNDFGAQEPGTDDVIKAFTAESFDVTFRLLEKQHAVGDEMSPLFRQLTMGENPATDGAIKWNFTKFLVGADGHVTHRFESKVDPMDAIVVSAVEGAMARAKK